MSIYTDMSKIIQERGLGAHLPVNRNTGQCCLLGAKALAKGFTVEQIMDGEGKIYDNTYKDVPELIDIIRETGIPDLNSWDDDDVIWRYNDRYLSHLVNGNPDEKALSLLAQAEDRRKEKLNENA